MSYVSPMVTMKKVPIKYTQKALTGVVLLGIIAQSEGSLVQFPLRAHARVVGSVRGGIRTRGNQSMFLSHQ